MKRIAFILLALSIASSGFAHSDVWGEDVHPEDNAQHLGYGFRKIPATDYFYDEAFVEGEIGKTVTNLEITEYSGQIDGRPGRLWINVTIGDVSFNAQAWTGQRDLIFNNGNDFILKLKYKQELGVLSRETFESQIRAALSIAS